MPNPFLFEPAFLVESLRRLVAEFRDIKQATTLRRLYPGLKVGRFSSIIVDTPAALKCEGTANIGSFCEIIVESISPFTRISGQLILGDRVIIGSWANIRAGGGTITLGDNVLLAQKVSIIAANHSLSLSRPFRDSEWDENQVGVSIGSNVWVGAGATLLPGTTVGQNSVVAAGSVVTKCIPSQELWAGIPARFVRKLQPSCSISRQG